MYIYMEIYGKGTRSIYVKLWEMECDWKCWRKGFLFVVSFLYLSFVH